MKDKLTAGLLALFVGGFGVHQFYLGKSGKGVLYIILFFGLFWILPLIDAIKLLTMDQQAFDALYNNGQSSAVGTASPVNVADELEKLHSLKEKGVITDEDFLIKKRQLLG